MQNHEARTLFFLEVLSVVAPIYQDQNLWLGSLVVSAND